MKILQINVPLSKCSICNWITVAVMSGSLMFTPQVANAITITEDPSLAFAINNQTSTLKDQYKRRSELRQKINEAQIVVSAALKTIHDVESKVLDYMKNASGVVTNMVQLKNIAEYTIKISEQLVAIGKSIPNNPKGAAITAACQMHTAETYADIVSMGDVVKTLVESTYSFKDGDSNSDKKHVNLLTAAERYSILMDVEQRMSKISYDLMLLQYYIRTLDWKDLWKGLDRESFLNAITVKVEINDILRKWNRLNN